MTPRRSARSAAWPRRAERRPRRAAIVIADLDALAHVVAGTPLAALPWRATPIPQTGWTGFEAPVPTADRRTLWETARALLPRTGRWPVLVFEGGENLYRRDRYAHGEGPAAQPDAILDRARGMTLADAAAARHTGVHDDYFRKEWEWIVTRELEETRRHLDAQDAPAREDLAHLGPPDFDALDRFLFLWEERVRPTTGRVASGEFECWSQEECTLVLVPTPHGHEAPAFVDYTMASRAWQHGHDALIVVLRDWHERFGTELVVAGGDLLLFDVAWPPTDALAAYDLACEQSRYAGLPDGNRRHYARDLLGRTDWYLRERF